MDKNQFIEIQKQILPEVVELMELRFNILAELKENQPVGRRHLANILNVSERHIRNEIDFFSKEGFVNVERQGILLSPLGEGILDDLKEVIYAYKNFDALAEKLRSILGIRKVFIVPGDCETSNTVLDFMGQKAARYVSGLIKADSVIGLTGGKSVASVAANMPQLNFPKATVIPARGGIGKSHSTQANSIASLMAAKIGAQKEMMYLPDNIDKDILEALKNDPQIKEVFDRLKEIDILIFGIGRADVMAKARKLSQDKISELEKLNAVSEAFGHFFDQEGKMIFPSSSVGITIEGYKNIEHAVAVSGGAAKAKAIIAVSKVKKDMVLVTDESAAKKIFNII
ncbi:sugar-binding transcriptional regulator [Alkalibacter mobilis]|uniref:sugar-binding transcriptional regulator n=1 Tax=Alkalibacter mobilis TaxID=2787712 RepID=UPI00189CC5B9|nr:sugar-binding domain-containing protein [Alkalibacter mobilis]MBF7097226.1 hypothetical protein [Alkalibacter mobilis]